jgi:6-phosphofructokinase 2
VPAFARAGATKDARRNQPLHIATATKRVVSTHKLRGEAPRRDPGGGGINVARVIHILGGQATAVYPAGGPTGSALRGLLDRAGVDQRVIPIRGVTRESFTVDEAASGDQFRFVLPGPEVPRPKPGAASTSWARSHPGAASWSRAAACCPGCPSSSMPAWRASRRSSGPRLIFDTSGAALRHAGGDGVFMLKPNLGELRGLVGGKVESEREQAAAAQRLTAEGRTEALVLSLGAYGALLVTRGVSERFAAIEVPIRSAVGAGDSMIGALVLGLARGLELREAVRLGMAAGAAALMTPSTELRADVERLYAQSRDRRNGDPPSPARAQLMMDQRGVED